VIVYWRSGQYGILQQYPPKERVGIVRAAAAKHGRGYGARFLLAFATYAAAVLASARYIAPRSVWDWRVWAILVGGGVLFYGYLLWEINGPMRAAVERYLAEEGDRHRRAPGRGRAGRAGRG
jgi:hypothetical protein